MKGVKSAEAVIDNGEFGVRKIRFETGRLARQASGSALVVLDEETVILSSTVASKHPKENLDFFPLTVDVEEKMYAIGRIPGSFFRREGRPSEDAILTCRLIDRPLRPSFVKGLRNEIQIVETILSLNPEHLYDVVAINAASMSTQLAGLPFAGPIGGVRVALIKDQWVAFPTHPQLEQATFDMVVAGRMLEDGDVAIMMVEAESTPQTLKLLADADATGAVAPDEETVAEGLEAAKPFIAALCQAQTILAAAAVEAGLAPATTSEFPIFADYGDDVFEAVSGAVTDELAKALTIAPKQERAAEEDRVKALALERLGEKFEGREKEVSAAIRSLTKKLVRKRVVNDGLRIDGRGLTDIRPLSAEVGVLPRVHGSALFERGETQILGVTTLNMLRMEQMVDTLNPERTKRYMHNYNMPPYSTGETGRVGSPKRREIGHGALAERAIVPVLPTREEFPYAIRQVSEALGSNGSTSMGSVCASTMALLNAGVPLKGMVSGIAMGLIYEGGTYVTLTDILGAEDAFGDMDFKVAGTEQVITALQLDTKLDGIPASVLGAALKQARGARMTILGVMREAVSAPGEMSPLRASDHHHQGPGGQDRRGHRPEGQDDQLDPGRHRRRDHDRGRRHDLHRRDRRPVRRRGQGRDQRDREPAHARGGRAVPRHRGEDDHVRRVRVAAARQGRPAARHADPQAARRPPDRERRRGHPHRRQDPGRDPRDRRPGQAVAGPGRGDRARGRGRGPRRRRLERGPSRHPQRAQRAGRPSAPRAQRRRRRRWRPSSAAALSWRAARLDE